MSKLTGLVELVQTAIDKGATSVEEVHRAIANEPLDILKKITPLEKPVKGVQNIQNMTIGGVYEIIRVVNRQTGEIALDLLEKAEKLETDCKAAEDK
jgi:hypothetical protein